MATVIKKRKKEDNNDDVNDEDDNDNNNNDVNVKAQVQRNKGDNKVQGNKTSSKKNKGTSTTSISNSNSTNEFVHLFPIGNSAKIELKRALLGRVGGNPVTRITNFQQEHSLHTMIAKACGTVSKHQHQQQQLQVNTDTDRKEKERNGSMTTNATVETLDTDSVMTFLHHLGVRQYDVHKRISDAILKNLELEIKKTTNHDALLQLLKQCWDYAASTSSTQLEIRPILWAVLRQLGTQTPTPVLLALAERSTTTLAQHSNNNKNQSQSPALLIMKHADVFRPLPSSIKRLVWEADWDNIVSGIPNGSGTTQDQQLQLQLKEKQQQQQQQQQEQNQDDETKTLKTNPATVYKNAVQSTLLFHTIAPHVQQYIVKTKSLVDNANRAYTSTASERRVLTSNRRALTKVSNTSTGVSGPTTSVNGTVGRATTTSTATSTTTTTPTTTNTSSLLRQAGASTGADATTGTANPTTSTLSTNANTDTSGKAISHIRSLLCDTVGTASSYRPKLLFSLLTMLIAHHGGTRLQFDVFATTNAKNRKEKDSTNDDKKTADGDDNKNEDNKEDDDDDEMDDINNGLGDEYSNDSILVVCGSRNLHCTLVADILLSAGGPLPKAYTHVVSLAQVLDECVQEGNVTDIQLCKIQSIMKLIFQPENKDTNDNAGTGTKDGGSSKTTAASKGGGGGIVGKSSGSSPSKKERIDNSTSSNDKVADNVPVELTKEEQRVLNKHIRNGLEEMKKSDTQNLFLNPVTDEIAPGYSKIISHPMCITMMEQNVIKNKYTSIEGWEDDVKLMYTNCIDYNQGPTGQWFRGEANRQSKIFKERIVPKLRRQHQLDKAKQQRKASASKTAVVTAPFAKLQSKGSTTPATAKTTSDTHNDNGKRISGAVTGAATSPKEAVAPLEPSSKRRKKEKEDFLPSMPALASMLLADPFVVRLFVARILRDVRAGVIAGHGLPVSHHSIPSLLQILLISQWSKQVCSIWGRKFVVPTPGLEQYHANDGSATETELIPYLSLRKCLPVLVRLLIEADLDKRTTVNGDLFAASQATPIQLPPIVPDVWTEQVDAVHLQISLSLVKGSLIHLCQPGNRNELSLHITFPKFASILRASSMSTTESALTLLEDKVFFDCLINAILRHKSKLPKDARDVIIDSWLTWLQVSTTSSNNDDSVTDENADEVVKKGSMTSTAHERLIFLLNEWHAYGGAFLPRDKLLSYATRVVEASNESEIDKNRRFDRLWNAYLRKKKKRGKKWLKYTSSRREFVQIKTQYERMISGIPETTAQQWKEQVNVVDVSNSDQPE